MLKGLSKPKGLKGLKGLGKPFKQTPIPDLDSGPERIASLVDDELARLANTLEDERLAKRVLKLKKKYPDGTIPELVVMDWLERKKLPWKFQFWVLGGREIRGGQVLDFIIDQGTGVLVLEVQGVYWHTRPGKTRLDEAQKFALLGISILGKKVNHVVGVWDSRIMDKRKRDSALNLALMGVEVGA